MKALTVGHFELAGLVYLLFQAIKHRTIDMRALLLLPLLLLLQVFLASGKAVNNKRGKTRKDLNSAKPDLSEDGKI